METKETVKKTATAKVRKTRKTASKRQIDPKRAEMIGFFKGKFWMAEGDIFNLGL